jgi:DNA-directed RNA polymerase specialized sigma24 family protein
MSEQVTARQNAASAAPVASSTRVRRAAQPQVSEDTRLAIEIRELLQRDEADRARERFAELVAIHQRRALRIAYQYLRNAAEADEAVQDAFVKVFSHIGTYREAWPFEVWFTRILINGCLDRRKSSSRRERWFTPLDPEGRIEGRQRTVFMLCHYGDCTPREVSTMTGLNESTVRVHLFRAARKLRALLGGKP